MARRAKARFVCVVYLASFGGSSSAALAAERMGPITTEIVDAPPFYFAEDYHQQYLAKNPYGYCGLGGTGVTCPMPAKAAAD